MSDVLRTYTFLPWLRAGISRRISTVDPLGANPGGSEREKVVIKFKVNSAEVSNPVELVGPGDILGINPRAIVKTEPRDWITNFEPNYLPYVEFYDEDLPWRYTPAKATHEHRLRPWLVLVAMTDDEFDDAGVVPPPEDKGGVPRPVINIKGNPGHIFPVSNQSWAWAHVQTAEDVSSDGALTTQETIDELENLIQRNPDQASARLLCPRKLRPNTAYHVMLLPAFEIGRKAGLGLDTTGQDALEPSWGNGQTDYPVYYRWYFRTSERGDFEYLVGLFEPRPVADEIGIRDMDMQSPDFGVEPLINPRVMGLEGALRKPGAVPRPEIWPPVEPFPSFLTSITEKINLAADRLEAPTDGAHPDPVVTLPLYGRWHAMIDRLNPLGSGWVNEINVDPRLRSASGLGTRVIQAHQDDYMKRAWEQVGRVIEANQGIRQAQFSIPTSYQIYKKNLEPLSPDQILALTTPVHARVMGSTTTIHQRVFESRLPTASLSPVFRKITRPRGRVMKKVLPNAKRKPSDLIIRLNDGRLTAATPKEAPAGQVGLDELSSGLIPGWVPDWLKQLLRHSWILLIILLFLILFVYLLAGAGAILAGVAAILAAVASGLVWLVRRVRLSDAINENGMTKETVESAPARPAFRILEPGTKPAPGGASTGPDSLEASHFRTAAIALAERLALKPPATASKQGLALGTASVKLKAALNPKLSIAKRLDTIMNVGQVFTPLIPVETIVEAMAHPSYPDPMYKPLRDLSSELLVPNLNKIPNNTISLMENNMRFIESYMVGLNHEMGRELLWREYPTDQRGSYFRQFWDVGDTIPSDPAADEATIEESLRDITPLYTWGKGTDLGDHQNREIPSGAGVGEARLVLVVRGELLKKYPTTVVFAQKARWDIPNDPSDPAAGTGQEVRLLDESATDGTLLTPLFKAEVEPDIHFFGFDLTASVAKGSKDRDDDDPGWFFVLQERPGEPRFGADIVDGGLLPIITEWKKLAWNHLGDISTIHTINLDTVPPTDIPAGHPDRIAVWGANAADMAYILYQDPVMVAFHAGDMLE